MLFLRRFAEALLFGLIAGFVLLVLAPVVLGWRPYTVLTGSMRPGIQPGDVVMDRPIKVTQAHIGEVVTFSDPTRHGELVTHRIRSITRLGDLTNVETRGDANSTSEHWTIATKDRVGLVVYRLPKIGRVAVLVRSRTGILVVIVIPVLLLAAGALIKIWKDDEDDATPEGGDGADPNPNSQSDPADDDPRSDAEDPDIGGADSPREPVTELQAVAQSPAHRAGVGADR